MAVYIEMFYANEKNEQTPILLDISTCTSVHVYLMNTDNLCIILQSNVRLIRAIVFNMFVFNCNTGIQFCML